MMQLMRLASASRFSPALPSHVRIGRSGTARNNCSGQFRRPPAAFSSEIGCPMAPDSHCNGQFGRPLNSITLPRLKWRLVTDCWERAMWRGSARRPKVTLRPIGGPKRDRGLDGRDSAHRAAICRGEGLGFVEAGEPFPVLQQLVEAEAGAAQRRRRVAAGGGGKASTIASLPSSASRASRAKARPPDAVHCRTYSESPQRALGSSAGKPAKPKKYPCP